MNVLSLFNGMGCIWLALDKLGIEVEHRYVSEIDKYANIVNDANYPDTIHLGDVTKVTTKDLEPLDLIVAGSPCQGFSFAGKQLNFDDPRSKLFFEFVRIRNENPDALFLLENVMMKKSYRDIMSEYLGVDPKFICSSNFSAQKRKRFYWTNIPGILEMKESKQKPFIESILQKEEVAENLYLDENNIKRAAEMYCAKTWHTGSKRGNMNFPNKLNWKSKCLLTGTSKGSRETNHVRDKKGIRLLTPIERERLQTVPDNYTNHVSNTQRYKMLGNGWTVDVIAHILKNIELL